MDAHILQASNSISRNFILHMLAHAPNYNMQIRLLFVALFLILKSWEQPKHPPKGDWLNIM